MTTKTKYFADSNGQATEVEHVHGMPNAEFATRFPGIKGRRYDSFSMFVGYPESERGIVWSKKVPMPVTRSINYKTNNPSKHVCDARCMFAKGRIMNCECSCGGKNHGQGGFMAEAA